MWHYSVAGGRLWKKGREEGPPDKELPFPGNEGRRTGLKQPFSRLKAENLTSGQCWLATPSIPICGDGGVAAEKEGSLRRGCVPPHPPAHRQKPPHLMTTAVQASFLLLSAVHEIDGRLLKRRQGRLGEAGQAL